MAKINRPWTQDEIDMLYEWAEAKPIEFICQRLNRTRQSVYHKARHLGIKLTTTLDHFSSGELGRITGINESTIRYWLKQKQLKARKGGVKGVSSNYRITRRAFADFYHANKNNKYSLKRINPEVLDWLIG
jgi:hypothetical protein